MIDYKFEEKEIPYGDLAKFGLTKEMIDDLPEQMLLDFCEGRYTPVLPIKVTTDDGKVIHSRSRLRLIRNEIGNAEVIFYPVLAMSKGTAENGITADRVKIGVAKNDDGREVKAFLQLDAETGQIMSVPTPVIGHNLQVVSDVYHLKPAELKCIQQGEAITVIDDNDEVTLGIDLNAPTGVRICLGDMHKWKESQKREYNKYNFGIYGCWVTDNDGNLDYVKEADFSQELIDERKKVIQIRAASMHK